MAFIEGQPALELKFIRDRTILAMTASAAYAATPNFQPKNLMNARVFSGIEDDHAIRDDRIDYSETYLSESRKPARDSSSQRPTWL
jgi:hypothetical protein